MTYKVIMTTTARRGLHALPLDVAEQIAGAIAGSPHRLGKELDVPFEGIYSARRGSYRILYEIDEHAESITIVAIGHRRDVYRPH